VIANSSVAAVKQRDTDVLKDLANEFNLTYTAFGSPISHKDEPAERTLTLTDAWGRGVEPAPVTPTDGDPVWELFSGTVKATYNAQRGLGGDNIVVSPGVLSVNTGGHSALVTSMEA
jgi:Gly-Xaa carboxypeptidase